MGVSIGGVKHHDPNSSWRKGLIWLTSAPSHISPRKVKTLALLLEAGTEVETVEERCLLAGFPSLSQFSYASQDYLPRVHHAPGLMGCGPPTRPRAFLI